MRIEIPWISLILVLVGFYAILGLLMVHRIRAARFAGRTDQTFVEVYREHFESSGISLDVAEELWNEAARMLRIPASKLRAQDRFDKELAHHLSWFPFVDLNDDFYWWAVERLRNFTGENSLLENAKTLGDYIAAFSRLGGKAV